MDAAFVGALGALPLRAPVSRRSTRAAALVLRMSLRGPSRGSAGRSPFGSDSGRNSSNNNNSNNNNGGRSGGSGSSGNGGRGRGPNPRGAGGQGDKASSNPLMAFWSAYNAALEAQPILVKALTSTVGFALGDLLAQKLLSGPNAPFDMPRLLRMAAFGFVVHGPVGHFFYGALDRAIPGTEAWKVVSKVAIDQILWAPIFTVIFFSFIGALEGRSVDDIVTKVKRDTWAGVTGSWKVWPIVHTINFRFIPTSQRLLYINSIQILYNVFLSFIGNKGSEPAAEPAKAPAPATKDSKAAVPEKKKGK